MLRIMYIAQCEVLVAPVRMYGGRRSSHKWLQFRDRSRFAGLPSVCKTISILKVARGARRWQVAAHLHVRYTVS